MHFRLTKENRKKEYKFLTSTSITCYQGFPFDDDNFGRRSDIRAHLDDLAARHPEFADHLLGPPWGDIPFHSSFRNRNRDSGNRDRNNHQQGYSDEDARSQASGSSAASGISASSSHGEADINQNQQNKSSNFEEPHKKSQIPQYGLRNTVDIGQHHHNMENLDRGNRGQRSMSAPPENRQSSNQQQPQQQEQQPQQQPQGQRYVSRIDITPQHNQPQQQKSQPQQSQPQPQTQQQQQKPQQQSNVRHIPIFVEGRDEPVLPRSFDDPSSFRRAPSPFRREPSPPQFHAPPHFQRTFGQHFGGRPHQRSPHFQESFYQPPSGFEHPSRRQQQTHTFQQPRQPQQQQYCERQPQQQYYTERQPQQQHYEQSKQQKSQQQAPPQQQQQPQQQEPPKPTVPKDPLEKVALVQKEVDSLAEQVKQYSGNSRTDKEYIYLDEMLTRELIKLDDIETEGRDNVRQARKNAIKTIQETISLLESKAPLPSQQVLSEEQEKQEVSNVTEVAEQTGTLDMHHKGEDQSQNKEAIPLPPAPSSPTKKSDKATEPATEKIENSDTYHATSQQQDARQDSSEPIETTPAKKPEMTSMEVQQIPDEAVITEQKEVENAPGEKEQENTTEVKETDVSAEKTTENIPSEGNKEVNPLEGEKIENVSENKKVENTSKEKKTEKTDSKRPDQEQQQKTEEKMEIESSEVKQSPRSKKGRKAKKQAAPVSDKPIPLPAPENTETSAN